MAMVIRANHDSSELGGHIASYQSLATLYEVGFNHFWHAPSAEHGGDLVYFQGHSSPGNYARAYLEGRLTEAELDGFRQEVTVPGGLSSYPHPWLMPDFWQFPTVSLGIGADHLDLPGAVHALPARRAGSPTPTGARCGRSSATARWTSPSRWAPPRWPAASSSTT